MSITIRGVLQNTPEAKLQKEGETNNRKWKMYKAILTIDGADYSLIEWSSTDMEKRLKGLTTGTEVEFDSVEAGNYNNVDTDTGITILKQGATPAPKPLGGTTPVGTPPIGGNVPAEVWDAKDRRTARIKASELAVALDINRIECARHNIPEGETIEQDTEQTIIGVARTFEDYFYEAVKKQ